MNWSGPGIQWHLMSEGRGFHWRRKKKESDKSKSGDFEHKLNVAHGSAYLWPIFGHCDWTQRLDLGLVRARYKIVFNLT